MELALQADKSRKISWKTLASIMVILLILAGSAGIYGYVYTYRPDIYKEVKLKLSNFGLAETDPIEVRRIADINALSIPYEEKQILINRTIFLGATPRMVKLALGNPKEAARIHNSESGEQDAIILIYHLPEELRPTMLRFEGGNLTHAYKGSVTDFNTTPVPYTGINSE